MEPTRKVRKFCKALANVLLYTFLAVCIFSVILTISSKKDPDGTSTIFGMQMRRVVSASMEKCDATDVSRFEIKDIPLGSMVFIEVMPEDPEEKEAWLAELEVGDVLTFKYVYIKQQTITHRITAIEKNENGGYTINLEGDNKNDNSSVLAQTINTAATNSPNYLIGKVTGQSLLIGTVIGALQSTVGLILVIIIPSLLIVIFEILKIAKIVTAEKREKERAERERQDNELAELRRRIAEYESGGAPKSDSES